MNYDESMKELELIISQLENENTKFEDAVALFEKGSNLCKSLNKSLNETKGKVTVIREELGALLEEDLNLNNTGD